MQEFNPAGRAMGRSGVALEPAASANQSAALLANQLLRRLGSDAAVSLITVGRRATFRAGQALWSAGEAADAICFPLKGVVAGLVSDLDGSAAQVECTGPEGAVGLAEGVAGLPHAFEQRAMVETEAWLVPVEAVRNLMRTCPDSADVIQRTLATIYEEARRASGCAARHSLRARLADCLLSYQEKMALERLPLTQEMLSSVLGANRTTVTALAIALSDAGLTRTGRGWVSILNAARLDRIACGCRKGAKSSDIRDARPSLA